MTTKEVSSNGSRGKLFLYNSLTRKKEEFVPIKSGEVLWYACGPTVYDHSHLGHARTYMTQDIIRRLMSSFFNYNIQYTMNITDIDDKIIKRGRQEHLLEEFLNQPKIEIDSVKKLIEEGVNNFSKELNQTTDDAKKQVLNDVISASKVSLNKLIALEKAHLTLEKLKEIINESKSAIMTGLDIEKGSSCNGNEIFSKFAKKYEQSFFEDLDQLNILRPDSLTRVTEFVPEIISYISDIIKNGYAYESNGSVYFDVVNFLKNKDKHGLNHSYPKLMPEAAQNIDLMREGEGEFSKDDNEKKNKVDFVLWKALQPGQPSWDSPWGKGRPGWHIECSAMSHFTLGPHIDIHSGGIDLKFPHHDNEIAQCEAYTNSNTWVNYFLHTGHLHISGLKMSKSLKNFITIKQILKEITPNQLRLLCMIKPWNGPMDYSKQAIDEVKAIENNIQDFFAMTNKLIEGKKSQFQQKISSTDRKFFEIIQNSKLEFIDCICDNFDVKEGLNCLRELIKSFWSYIKGNDDINISLIKTVKSYLDEIFLRLGFVWKSYSVDKEDNSESNKVSPSQLLKVIADFREEIRIGAKKSKSYDLLKICDKLRDSTLPSLGVKMSDTPHGTVVKIED